MAVLLSMVSTMLLFVALMIPGFILGKRSRLYNEAIPALSNILTDIAMPALVFSKLVELDLRELSLTDFTLSLLITLFSLFAVLFITTYLLRKRKDEVQYSAQRVCATFPNCGFLGIPLACALFPDKPGVAVCVSLANVVNSFLLLTLGVYILSGDKKAINPIRALVNPVFFALLLGFAVSFSGFSQKLSWICDYSGYFAAVTTPLSMTVLGFELSGVKNSDIIHTRGFIPVTAIRLLLSPFLTLAVLMLLRAVGVAVGHEIAAGLVIVTGVSSASSLSALARKNGADGRCTALLTLETTIMSVITVPLWLYITEIIF